MIGIHLYMDGDDCWPDAMDKPVVEPVKDIEMAFKGRMDYLGTDHV